MSGPIESSMLALLGGLFLIYIIISLLTGWYTIEVAACAGVLSSIAVLLITWGLDRTK